MRRGGTRAAIMLAAIAALGLVGLVAWATRGAGAAGAESAAVDDRQTSTVEERTLRVTEDLSGVLGYGEERPITAGVPGTLTAWPDAGTRIERGETLFAVNGAPAVLLYGEVPAWRAIEDGVGGPDVEQLERNLMELGYGDGLQVDETWDADTTEAVEAWQEDAGMRIDGRVDLGEIVFEPDAVIVAGVEVSRGGSVGPGTPVLRVTGTERMITASLPADRRDGVDGGDGVDVELADGTVVEATVAEIDPTATTGQDGSRTYGMRLTLEEADAGATEGPVWLRLVRQEREDVLAVPVDALLALLEGGYAVERMTDDGRTELVPVEVGLFADGWVEVRGELAAGDKVVVP